MKKMIISMLMGFAVVLFISACEEEPSDDYIGDWPSSGVDADYDVQFGKDKKMKVTINTSTRSEAELGPDEPRTENFDIKQTGSGTSGDAKYYELDIEEEKHFLVFENKDDITSAKLLRPKDDSSSYDDMDEEVVYVMNKDGYPGYDAD